MRLITQYRSRLSSLLSCVALVLILVSAAGAGMPLPGHVYVMDDMDEAVREAEGWEQPLAFVWTDLDSGCRLAESAAFDAFQELRNDMTLVYACSKSEWKKLPALVRKALNSGESGKYIPKTVVVDPALTEVIAVIPYIRDPEERISVLESVVEAAAESD